MPESKRMVVAQVISCLDFGGAELVAVNLANELAARGHESHVISTRGSGPMAKRLRDDVKLLAVERRRRWDFRAIRRIAKYIAVSEPSRPRAAPAGGVSCA